MDTAESRADFIKRLFAVTLSVGIANQISHIVFSPLNVEDGHLSFLLVLGHWRSLLLLLISLAIIVYSWEGYLSAINKTPLRDVGRFVIDIALVFSYLLMTLSVEYPNLWFLTHVLIFIEYFLWDILRERTPEYSNDTQARASEEWYETSKSITIFWLIYFSVLFLMKTFDRSFEKNAAFALISLVTFGGVAAYRNDKIKKYNIEMKFFASALALWFTFAIGCL